MIPDNQTNFLYLADTLPIKHPEFYKQFGQTLNECNIDFALLPHTKDVWAVDYMPVQASDDRFVQFAYAPDYLMKYVKLRKTISDVDAICKAIGISPVKSGIVLDGGNVSRWNNKVILTDKVFRENAGIAEKDLIRMLQNLFEVDRLIFVPQDPEDITGHADGMVRFIDADTVLINDYSACSGSAFQTAFRMALHNAGLEYVAVPYCPDLNSAVSAEGLYLNYLQMKDAVVIPVFGRKEDEQAVKQLEDIFTCTTIRTVDGMEVAKHGGVLNCISWNIKKGIRLNS